MCVPPCPRPRPGARGDDSCLFEMGRLFPCSLFPLCHDINPRRRGDPFQARPGNPTGALALAGIERPRWLQRRGSPLTIPNREVKPVSADGTAIQWESRSPPSFKAPIIYLVGVFFLGTIRDSPTAVGGRGGKNNVLGVFLDFDCRPCRSSILRRLPSRPPSFSWWGPFFWGPSGTLPLLWVAWAAKTMSGCFSGF